MGKTYPLWGISVNPKMGKHFCGTIGQCRGMASYLRIALDYLRSSAATDASITEAAMVLPAIASKAVARAGGVGSLHEYLTTAMREDIAAMAVFHRRVAEAAGPSDSDLAGHNAALAVICFGNIGVYEEGGPQHELFKACVDRYARSQALSDALS